MRFSVLLAGCIWLFYFTATAQTTISGRVLDAKSGDAMPGATVLQTGTTNGASSDMEGNFTLTVPASTDSIALTFSSVGYVTQRRRVAPGSTSTVRMALSTTKIYDCGVIHYSLVEIGFRSGVRYAPFGARLRLDGHRLIRLPLAAACSYQTDFSHNHSLHATLELPPIHQYGRVTIKEKAEYQHLQATAADLRFSSYLALMELGIYRIGSVRLPTILLGGGYACYQPLLPEAATTAGYGYHFGLQHDFLAYPLRLFGTVQATRWPTFWQWQGRLAHPFASAFQAGVEVNHLRQYTEFSATISRFFY